VKDFMLRVRMTMDLNDMVNAAAKKSGLNTADWVRAVLARAANEGAFAPRKGDRHGSKPKRKPTP
jgi:antitoxin component of RelBE/YafQ-DinJ toxin-antitoxin module